MMVSDTEWTELSRRDLLGTTGFVLRVADEVMGHCLAIGNGEPATVAEALRDYAGSYDAAYVPGMIDVRWGLYHDGIEVQCGQWSFEAR